jgi:hypothetical protein
MMKSWFSPAQLLVIGVFTCWPVAARADLVIDTFDSPTPAQKYNDTSANPFTSTVPAGSAGIGLFNGSRTYTVTQTDGAALFTLGTAGAIGTDPLTPGADKGSLRFFSGSIPSVGVLEYPSTIPSGSPANFAGAGDQFVFDFGFVDGGIGPGSGALLETFIQLTTTSGPLTASVSFPDSTGPVGFSVPFSAFSGPGSFSSVTGLRIFFNDSNGPFAGGFGEPQTDFQLNSLSLRIIPEPGSLLVWGLVGVTAVVYSRRRLKAKAAA